MTAETNISGNEQALAEVILTYLEAVDAGLAPDRRKLLDEHPALAADLEEFFAGRDAVERVAGPLRGFVGSGLASVVHAAAAHAGSDHLSLGLASPGPSAPLGELGDFRLLREIGRGGMGTVYEAHQISLNRRVALKVLPLASALDPKHLARFKQEAQAAAQLHHTNIVPVFAVGAERGVHYYAMQLIEGQSLAAIIAELQQANDSGTEARGAPASALLDGIAAAAGPDYPAPAATAIFPATPDAEEPPPTAEAPAAPETAPIAAANISTDRSIKSQRFFRRVAHVGVKAAEALQHAHDVGVVHRDVKPANLLLDSRGNVWVTDFGLALFKDNSGLTMTGELLGTLRYMSPEQTFAKRGLVDHRADIYSLGATLYELATLQPVFAGSDRQELLHNIAYEEPRRPRAVNKGVPIELETIILKALGKNPEDRYATAQEMADDLQRFLQDKPVLARRPSLAERTRKWARRHRPIVYSAAALLVMAVVGLSAGMVIICREHSKTVAALAEARDQRDLAEKSSEQARQAMDFFTEVAQEDLDQPGLEPVRRRLLQRALEYYQGFMELHHQDPALQARLVDSYANVANILDRLGQPAEAAKTCAKARDMAEQVLHVYPGNWEVRQHLNNLQDQLCKLQGVWELTLIRDPFVREDLKLSQEQLIKVERLSKEFSKGICVQMEAITRLPNKDRHVRYVELVHANERAVLAALDQEQARRLKQIALQRRGPDAFNDPEVVLLLGLSPEQQRRIASIKIDCCSGAVMAGKARMVARLKATQKIMEMLTPEQRTKWVDLVGPTLPG